jgi:outer membrane autotransporter protein
VNHIALSRLRAVAFGLLVLPFVELPSAAYAACTPATSTATPVTNSTVTCTGATLNQNNPFFLNTGYGTFNETGDTINVDPTASVTGDTFGFALADGNIVNNSGAVSGGAFGINTTTGSTITVNNLTGSSTISGTNNAGLDVTNVVLSNAGTILGGGSGIFATGSVVLTSNTGAITGTGSNSLGISANSVSGSNAGTISGVIGIGSDVNLSSNSGVIEGNGGFAINSNGDVLIGTNSGTIASTVTGNGFARAINAGGSVNVTNTSTGNIIATGGDSLFDDAIVAVGDVTVVNSGTIMGDGRAIDAMANTPTSLNLTNNSGGLITSGNDAVDAIGAATITNAGTITSANGNGLFIIGPTSITNIASGIIESTGTNAEALIASSLLLNNAGTVRVTNTDFFAVDAITIEAGSTNSGTISGNLAAVDAIDIVDMSNSGTITGGILAIQADNAIKFDNMGTVSGDRRAFVANGVEITNSGTITATGGSGLQAIAIITLTGNITNTATGVISATGTAANNDAINTSDTTTVDNFGMISSTGRSAVRVDSNASISNEAGGTITGVTGIVFRDVTATDTPVVNGSVFNAGTITGTGGVAIDFAFTPGSGPMTLTLGPGSVINGSVLGTGADTFQLGGIGSDTFDVDNIGATLQYQGFTAFNKIDTSTWTLTGTGAQNWSVNGGTLIGDTNSLGAATYPVSAGATLEFKQDFDGTYTGVVSGAGNFAKDGTGVLTLTGGNVFTGSTTILGGTLALSGTGSIANSSNVTDNATFDVSAASGGASIQSLDGNGNVVLGANTVTLTNASGDFTGVIGGPGGFVVSSGIETLSGANTFTGLTTVTAAATLQIGDGGTTGSIVGNVVDDGTLVVDRSDSVTVDGTISGSGSVSQIGSGTTILTAADTYAGGTTISSGTLQLGNGGTAGSIVGDVTDNGTLAFDRSDSVTFGGVISGSGGVSQIGSGTTILTGTSTYSGPTAVVGGTLDVNGSIANSSVTVNSGATLKGNGTVGNLALASGGIVAPGNSIGTLHVAGNVTFASGSIFSVEVNATGVADLIDATGTATIASGALVAVSAAPGTYQSQTTYKIVTAAGGVSGTFNTPSVNLPFLAAQLVYAPTEVDLILTLKDIDFTPLAHTPNEIATGAAVKAAGPQGGTIFGDFLLQLPDTSFITGALDQLSGEIHPSLETAALEDTQVVRQSVLDRLRQSTTGDASGLLAPSSAQSRPIVDGLTMWTHVFAESGSVDSDGNAAEIRQNESGILAGVDAALDRNLTLGIGGGYTHSHLNQRTSSSSGGDGYVIASGGWSQGPFALRAGGSYAWGDRNVTRHVSFPGFAETLTSKPNEHASQVFGEAGYSARTTELALEPFVGITWSDAATGAFAETGGNAALSSRGGDTSQAYSSLGLRLATDAIGGDSLALTPRASLSWQHAFGHLRPQQIVSFEDTGQSFLVLGTAIDSDMANIDLGMDAKIGEGGRIEIGYEGILSSRVRLNTIHAGLNWAL